MLHADLSLKTDYQRSMQVQFEFKIAFLKLFSSPSYSVFYLILDILYYFISDVKYYTGHSLLFVNN